MTKQNDKNIYPNQSTVRKLERATGILKKFTGNCGFIYREGYPRPDVYVSLAEFMQAGLTPKVGMSLQFCLSESSGRRIRATDLRLADINGNIDSSAKILPMYKDNAVVKWFNWEKGYGFVTLNEEDKDVFIHVSVLRESGVTEGVDLRNCKVRVKTGAGNKEGTVQVTEIRIV